MSNSQDKGSVRILTVFVSSPGDVAGCREAVDEVVDVINKSDGRDKGYRLDVWRWENEVAPQTGPGPQPVVESQLPDYDIYLGILSARFGTPTKTHGSGTEEEFRSALDRWRRDGRPHVSVYFDKAPVLSQKTADVAQYLKVCELREELEPLGINGSFTGVRGGPLAFYDQLREKLPKVAAIVLKAEKEASESGRRGEPSPAAYLKDLAERNEFIDIRGLQLGKAKVVRLPIREHYMTLTTHGVVDRNANRNANRDASNKTDGDGERSFELRGRATRLEDALRHEKLLVIGDPGGGKTTFLRRATHLLCRAEQGRAGDAKCDELGLADRTFPIFVRVSELAEHIDKFRDDKQAPAPASPAWLGHFLERQGASWGWRLEAEFFHKKLEAGQCTVLIDGLDETSQRQQAPMLQLIEHLAAKYKKCRFVVTSRPAANDSDVILAGFTPARIEPLSDDAVKDFLAKWCAAIIEESSRTAQEHCDDLLKSLRARPELVRIARNPVMLTALAVVHWNERELPAGRALLYRSILHWLAKSREQRDGRPSPEKCLTVLRELALAMRDDPSGRKIQVERRWAAEKIASELTSSEDTKETVARAERFLDDEQLDSGIIVPRGNELTFWHQTFAEYLAAEAIAGRLEWDQRAILFPDKKKVYRDEWRVVVPLLAATLLTQGKGKLDWLIARILDTVKGSRSLPNQARCVGLIGSIIRDLPATEYEVTDARYPALRKKVEAIFDRDRALSVPVRVRVAAADSLAMSGDPRFDVRRADYWVSFPACSLWIGAQAKDPKGKNYDRAANHWENPVHRVYLSAFRLARFPVTVGQYREFVEDGGYQREKLWTHGGWKRFESPVDWDDQLPFLTRPVVGVSWFEAAAFCEWSEVRLPTSAEWERAARGVEGRRFPWGDVEPSADGFCNCDRRVGSPSPVGIFPLGESPDGLVDMAGNVWEWCWDWYEDYQTAEVRDPGGPVAGRNRVVRGGSWDVNGQNCRSAHRDGDGPGDRSSDLGFRVAAVRSSQETSTSQAEG